jgi:hypothetical protein
MHKVTTQVIQLIKKYEKIIASDNEEYDKDTLKKVTHELQQELYKYKPCSVLELEE